MHFFVNFHALLPTFPFFVTWLGGDAVTIGLATALFSVASIVSRPFVGWLIDRTQPFVITISDEYGSGDHRIGELLAQRLGVKFYDRELISLTAHIVMDESGRYGTDEKHAEAKIKSGWHCPFHLGDGVDALALSRLRPDCGFRIGSRLMFGTSN